MEQPRVSPIENDWIPRRSVAAECCGQGRERQLMADKTASAAMNFETIHDHSEGERENDHSNCGEQARQIFNQGLSADLRLGA
jgi:hypothetical protein